MLKSHSETKDIVETLSESYANEKNKNREYLLKILQNVRFLARQDLALRGDGLEENSNFVQLFPLRAEDDDAFIKEMIIKKIDKYTIMANEVTDASNREQVIVCLRWIDEQFEAHEEFIELHKVDKIQHI